MNTQNKNNNVDSPDKQTEEPAAAAPVTSPKSVMPHKKWLMVAVGVVVMAAIAAVVIYLVSAMQRDALVKQLDKGLGSMTYTADTAKAVKATAKPDADTTMSVTDAKGYAWTLKVPAGALVANTEITLTPFASVNAPGGYILNTGVSFAPDGLLFTKPALLTVIAPQGAAVQLYTSKHDGSQLTFADMPDKHSARLLHFSGAAAGPSGGNGSFASTLKDVQGYVASVPNRNLPTPPNLNIHCTTSLSFNANDPAIQAYISGALEPERTYAANLAGALRRAQLMGEDNPGDTDAASAVFSALFDRVATRINGAVMANRGNKDALPALAGAGIITLSTAQTYNSDWGKKQVLLSVLGKWALELANTSLGDLANKHAYSNIPEVVYLINAAHQLQTDTATTGDALGKALSFTLHITEAYGYPKLGATFKSEGDVPLEFVAQNGSSVQLKGSGTIKNDLSYGQASQLLFQSSPSFTTSADVHLLNFCTSPEAKVKQSTYGSAADTGTVLGGSTTNAQQDLFSTYVGIINPGGEFSMKAKDGNEQAAKDAWSRTFSDPTYGSATLTLTYEIKHTPKK